MLVRYEITFCRHGGDASTYSEWGNSEDPGGAAVRARERHQREFLPPLPTFAIVGLRSIEQVWPEYRRVPPREWHTRECVVS